MSGFFLLIVVLFGFLNIKSVKIYFSTTLLLYKLDTKEFARIGYHGFLFPHTYSGDGLGVTHIGLHLSTHAGEKNRHIQYGPFLLYLTHVHSVTLVGQGDYRVITSRYYFSDGQLYIVGIYDSSVNVFNVYQSSIYTLPISTTNSLQFNKSKMFHN